MSQSLDQLLQGMSHYDKDNRFMAASDLTVYMLTASTVEAHQQTRICSALLKQLEDSSLEVQGNAIKCIGRLMPVFNPNEASAVIAKVTASMVEGVEELRDVFATGFKTFLPAISDSLAEAVFSAVFPRTLTLLKSPTKFSLATKEHVVDVASEVVRRFGISDQWKSQTEALPSLLFQTIASEASSAIRRRCIGLLGALAAAGDVDILVRSWVDRRAALDRLTATRCLAAIARGAGALMTPYLARAMPLFLENLEIPADEDEYEVVEVSLGALEALVQLGHVLDEYLIHVLARISDLLKFDPYGEGDDEDFDTDEEDLSWKLRRAAAAVAASLARSRGASARTALAPLLRERLRAEREEVVVVELVEALEALEVCSQIDSDFQASVDAVLVQARRRGVGQKALRASLGFLGRVCRANDAARPVVAAKCGEFFSGLLASSLAPETLEALEAAASGFAAEAAAAVVARMETTGVLRSPQNRVHSAALRVAAVLDTQGVSLAPAVDTLWDAKADAEVKDAAIAVFVKFASSPTSDAAVSGCSALAALTRTDATRVPALKALEVLVSRNFQVDLGAVAETLEVATAQHAALRVFTRGVEAGNFGREVSDLLGARLLRVLRDAEGETATEAVRLAKHFWTSDANFQKACLEVLLSPLTQPSTVDELSDFFANFRSAATLFSAAEATSEAVQKNVARVLGGMSEISAEQLDISDPLHLRVLGDLGHRRGLAEPAAAATVLRRISDAPTVDEKSAAAVAAWGGLVRGFPELAVSAFLPAVASATSPQTKSALLDELTAAVAFDDSFARPEVQTFLLDLAAESDEGCREAAAQCLAAVALRSDSDMDAGVGERLMLTAFDKNKLYGLAALRGAALAGLADLSRKSQVLLGSRKHFSDSMHDADFRVRQKTYLAGEALVSAGLGASFGLMEQGVFEAVFADVAVNPAFIKVVDLGPFKHRVDEGVGLRRAAASLCLTLARSAEHKLKLKEALQTQKELVDIHVLV